MTAIALLAITWQEATGWIALANFTLIGFTLLSILSLKKETTSAVAWCLTVLFMPLVGVIFYWLFGYQSVHRPLRRKKKHAKAYLQRRTTSSRDLPLLTGQELPGSWEDLTPLAVQLGATPLIGGNRVTLFDEGEQAFEAMFKAIRSARHHIHMEFFIFRADDSGKQFIEALAERAKAGVQVRFLYDAVGSWTLHRWRLQQLIDAGGKASAFLTLNPLRRRIQLNLRNHRKIVVVDGRTAFTGGFNIGDEYRGKAAFFGPWRDTFMQLEGPAARGMQRIFIEDWNFATGEEIVGADYHPQVPPQGTVAAQIAWSGPDQEIKTIREIYFAVMMRAKKRLWVASPYFVPDSGLMDALCLAARSGRDVRLLLPFRPDKWLPFLAARYYWRDALTAGVKIYQYTNGFMHAKVWIADDIWASVGSANFDNRSLHLNFEAVCLMESREVVAELEAAFLRDFALSIRVDLEQFEQRGFVSRLAENFCRLMSPVL